MKQIKIKNQLALLGIIGFILISLNSCVKDDIENTFIENFDLLWTIMDENYAGFNARNVDWHAVRDIYRPQALQATTEEELFVVCSRMIYRELDDGHNSLVDRNAESYSGDDVTLEIEDVYDINVIENNYLQENFEKIGDHEHAHHVLGKIKNENIGYLRLFQMEAIKEGPHYGWEEKIDQFIEDIKDTDGLIIDLRINGGGFTPLGFYLAGRFAATKEFAFNIQTKNGPGHNDFDDPSPNYIEPTGNTQYTKPIILLTDQYSASNAEDFTIMLVTQDHVTHIGETTSGIFSNISLQRYLPNGWSVAFSHQLYTYEDGTSPEGVGIIPEIEVINTPVDWNVGTDNVIEAAIDLLK